MGEISLGAIMDRFRANLAGAGIVLAESEFERVEAMGLLRQVHAFEDCVSLLPPLPVPDYLESRGEREARPRGTRRWQPGPETRSPILDTSRLVGNRELSPVDLAARAIERIGERDPLINAFQELLVEEVIRAARAAEAEILAGRYLGPLHGIPVAVKDIFDLRGTATRAGSAILGGRPAEVDATAVSRLRAAGAILIGKTRMSEFAYSPGSNNDNFGPTRNPRATDRDSGGSSSGSAAAVADGMAFAALGTDTGGSVRIPASFCGIVGFKPSFGRASLAGCAGLSWSLDHPGFLARSAADAALLLGICEGPDALDPRTSRWSAASSGEAGEARRDPRGMRIGVLAGGGGGASIVAPEAAAAWEAGIAWLGRSGFDLVEVELPELRAMRSLNTTILAIEAAQWHHSLQRESLGLYGDFTRLRLLAGWAYGPADFVRAHILRSGLRRRFEALFEGIDVLVTPTMMEGPPPLAEVPRLSYTSPFNLLGLPAFSMPAGLTDGGLPLGLQIVSGSWGDHLVLDLALLLEAEGFGAPTA